MEQTPPLNPSSERCPFLGLNDDPQTIMAYPSPWNWCHGAEPPTPVSVSYQRTTCLHSEHKHCVVYISPKSAKLPAEFISNKNNSSRGTSRKLNRFMIFLIVFGLIAFFVVGLRPLYFPGVLLTSTSPFVAASLDVSTSQQTKQFMTEASTPSISQPSPEAGRICGHALGVPFSSRPQFVIHIVKSGESLNGYAEDYRTTAGTILSINSGIRTPIWENTVIVIPIGTTLNVGIPAFEVVQISKTKASLVEISQSFQVDMSLFGKYNDFDDTCEEFSGWVLLPREKVIP